MFNDTQDGKGIEEQEPGEGIRQARKVLAFIGQRIRTLRIERGYSQESFALEVGLARSYYGSLERGERNFSVEHLLKIARGLQVEANSLLPPLSSLISTDPSEGLEQKGQQIAEQAVEGESTQAVKEIQAAKRARYVSAGVAAKILGVDRRTIARWVADGILAAVFVEDSSGKLLAVFEREAFQAFLETDPPNG